MTYLVDSFTDACRLHRDSYLVGVQRSLALECGTCSDVGMAVDGRSTSRCRNHPRSDPGFPMNHYTYYILHNDLHEDISTT